MLYLLALVLLLGSLEGDALGVSRAVVGIQVVLEPVLGWTSISLGEFVSYSSLKTMQLLQ